MSRWTDGVPGRPAYVQRVATSRRCQSRSVAGATMKDGHIAHGPSRLAAARNIWSDVFRAGRPVRRHMMASSWRRTTISSSLKAFERNCSTINSRTRRHDEIRQRDQHAASSCLNLATSANSTYTHLDPRKRVAQNERAILRTPRARDCSRTPPWCLSGRISRWERRSRTTNDRTEEVPKRRQALFDRGTRTSTTTAYSISGRHRHRAHAASTRHARRPNGPSRSMRDPDARA